MVAWLTIWIVRWLRKREDKSLAFGRVFIARLHNCRASALAFKISLQRIGAQARLKAAPIDRQTSRPMRKCEPLRFGRGAIGSAAGNKEASEQLMFCRERAIPRAKLTRNAAGFREMFPIEK